MRGGWPYGSLRRPSVTSHLPGEQGLHLHYLRMRICWQASLFWVEMMGGGVTNRVGPLVGIMSF